MAVNSEIASMHTTQLVCMWLVIDIPHLILKLQRCHCHHLSDKPLRWIAMHFLYCATPVLEFGKDAR